MKNNLLFYCMFLCCLVFASHAQDRITGTVKSLQDSEALPGVTILIKGTTTGTVTDVDGTFSIKAASDDELIFSFIGFETQEVFVGGRTQLSIFLETDIEELEEVVVVAYGTVKKSDLTGSVSSIKAKDINNVPASSPVQALQGKVAGVRVVSNSGSPGEPPSVRIRGLGTYEDASPIFVVDGIILQDITFLNSGDIESMEVLKDASATSLYGARGANGVILVTTKSGSVNGKTTVNITAEYGVQRITDYIDMLGGKEFAEIINEIQPGTFNNLNLVDDVDWQREVYRDAAPIHNYQASVSGGADKMGYYLGLGYFDQEGIIPGSAFEKLTVSLNNFYKPHKAVKLGHNLNFTRFHRDNSASVTASTLRAWPTDSPFDENGDFAEIRGNGNPLASIEYTNNYREGTRLIGSFYAEVTPMEGLTFKTSFGIDNEFANNQSFTPVFFVSPQQQNVISNLSKGQARTENWLWENTVNYKKNFGDHDLSLLLGYTAQEDNFENITGASEDLIRDFITYLPSDDLEKITSVGNSASSNSYLSYFFRLNYKAFDRYLITLSARRDGSSRFPVDNRYGFFPAVGLGWNISEEGFFQSSSLLSFMKLRASYGIIGNDKINNNAQFTLINQAAGAVLGREEVLNSGATYGSSGNPRIKWEEASQFDVGLETGFFNDAITLEFDYYRRVTQDILAPVTLPAHFGNGNGASTFFNTAQVLNRGIEIDLRWREKIKDVSYSIGVNATTVYNEVLTITEDSGNSDFIVSGSLGNGQNVKRTQPGEPIGYFYGYKVAGVFQNEEELSQFPVFGNQGVGDFRYEDVNGDGELTEEDRTFIGSHLPDLFFGVNFTVEYKGLELLMDWQGEFGKEIYDGKDAVRSGQFNYQSNILNAWSGEGTSNSEPRITTAGVNYSPSDWFVEDGSFVRLRTVSLSYNLPKSIASKLSMTNARVYLRGTNVLTFTEYSGYTPEIGGGVDTGGIDRGAYPVTGIYSLGVNLTF